MPKFTVQVDGKPVEVEVSNEQIASSGEFLQKEQFSAELTRRALSIAKSQGYKLPEELVKDPDFVKKVLSEAGVDLSKQGDQAQAVKDALDRQKRDLTEGVVKPLEIKVTAAEQREEELLQRDLQRQIIMAAGAAGIKKTMFKAGPGGVPPIVSMLMDNFAFDTEKREFYVVEGKDRESFAFSQLGDASQPYMTVEEFVNRWAQDKANADFIDVRGQAGPGLAGAAGRPTNQAGNVVHISKTDSRDLRKLMAAQAEARKRGLDPRDGVVVDEA